MKEAEKANGQGGAESTKLSERINPLRRVLWSIPLGWQLSGLYTLLLVATLAVVGAVVYTQQQDFLVQDAAMRLQQSATPILASPGPFGEPGSQDPGRGATGGRGDPRDRTGSDNALHLDLLVRGLSGPGVSMALLDPNGKVITSTQAVSNKGTPTVDPVTPQQLAQAAAIPAGNTPLYWVARHSDGSRYVVVLTSITQPIYAENDLATGALLNNSTAHLLEQSASLAAADAALSRLGTYLLLGVIGGTIAGLVLGTAFTRGVLRPLDRVAHTAEAIAAGDLARRLRLPTGRNEVARLGTAFDYMVGRLVSTLEAQRRFVADASHELRTPLTSLKGLAEILMIGAHGNDRSVIEQSAGAINGELERLIRLVTDLLTLSHFDNARSDGAPPTRRTRMDACASVEAAVTQMGALAERREVHLHHTCDGPLWLAGDPGQLKQVLLNLLDNALRHTPAGGDIRLSSEAEGASLHTEHPMARIEVSDTGSGIDQKDLPHIFERFYRGDVSRARATGNTGLGLAIVKTIVEAHGGTIAVQSSPGSGTHFIIRLPLASGPAMAEEQAARVTASR